MEKSRDWRKNSDSFKGKGYNKRLRFINYTGQYLYFHEIDNFDDPKSDVCEIAIRHVETDIEKPNIITRLHNRDSITYHIADHHLPLLRELDKVVGSYGMWMLKKTEDKPTAREKMLLNGLSIMIKRYQQKCDEWNHKSKVFRDV